MPPTMLSAGSYGSGWEPSMPIQDEGDCVAHEGLSDVLCVVWNTANKGALRSALDVDRLA